MRTLQENGKTFVLIPMKDYERLCKKQSMADDIAVFDTALARGEESFPFALFDAIDTGANAVAVLRKYRGMTQHKLAGMVGIKPSYLSQIESGAREGAVKTLKAIADALDVPLDMLA